MPWKNKTQLVGLSVKVGILLGLSSPIAAIAQIPGVDAPKQPKIDLQLLSSAKAIQPGKPFDLAVKFDLEHDWHIYWKNSGDSGKPTRVKWTLPKGFVVSTLRYPMPKRYFSPGPLVTNVHEGQPIFTATVNPPSNLKPGSRVKIQADVDALACKTLCIPLRRSIAIELPVASSAAEVKPDNENVFAAASSAFPQPMTAVKHLKLKPVVNVNKVRPKDKFKFTVVLDLNKGLHIQSNKPLDKYLIATDLFLESTRGISFGPTRYPPHEVRILPGNMKVAEFAGQVIIQHDVEADNTLPPGPLRIAGILRYQACKDSGQCFPPQNIEWMIEVSTGKEGDKVRLINDQYFTKASNAPEAINNPPDHPPDWRPGGLQESNAGDRIQAFFKQFGVFGLLFASFVYGLFLNATPCVLPLLSIKVLGFVQQAHESRRRTLMLGLAFGAGVILFFVPLGLVAAAGKNLLQYPAVVIGLSAVVMALALSMLGVYTLNVPTTATKLEAGIRQEGILASFGKGALAPVLGFACTGPLLVFALGWAVQQPSHIAVLAFLFGGLGMASPYMLLGANPNWLSFVPKPGPWMVTFERIMGFLLLAMVIWLLHPLITQIGAVGLEWTLIFFVTIAMACWVLGRINLTMPTTLRWRYRGGAAAIVLGTGVVIYGMILATPPPEIPWQTWSAEAVDKAVRSGKTVFVDFTAAWCTVCKQNKLVALNTPEVVDKIAALGVVPFQGDFTSFDPLIAAELQKHRRIGIPLNILYPAGQPDAPILLRTVLTKQYLLEKLDEAGPSTAALVSER